MIDKSQTFLFGTLIIVMSITFVSAGFGDWWSNLFTGEVIEEDPFVEDPVLVGAEDPAVFEATFIEDPVPDPFGVAGVGEISAEAFAEHFEGSGEKGSLVEQFREAVESGGFTHDASTANLIVDEGSKVSNVVSAEAFGAIFEGAGDQGRGDEFLAGQDTQTVSEDSFDAEPQVEQPTSGGFFGWFARLFGFKE